MKYERTGPLGIGKVSFNNNDDVMRWKEKRLPGEEGKWTALSPLNADAILRRIEELIRENERLSIEIEKLRAQREDPAKQIDGASRITSNFGFPPD